MEATNYLAPRNCCFEEGEEMLSKAENVKFGEELMKQNHEARDRSGFHANINTSEDKCRQYCNRAEHGGKEGDVRECKHGVIWKWVHVPGWVGVSAWESVHYRSSLYKKAKRAINANKPAEERDKMVQPNILANEERRALLLMQDCTDDCIPYGNYEVGDVDRCKHERIRMCIKTKSAGRRSCWRLLSRWMDRALYKKAEQALDEAATS